MPTRRSVSTALILGAFVALTGCASLPSPEVMKAETATFRLPKLPDQGKAMVYVVRPSPMAALVRFNVFVDDQEGASEMGHTRSSEYIQFHLQPGEHKIYSKAENWAETTVVAQDGDVIFIQQEPAFGLFYSRNNLSRLDDVQGKYQVKNLKVGTVIKMDK